MKSPPLPTTQNDQTLDPFQSETLPASGERQGQLLDLSRPAKERQCEASLAGHDGDRRDNQWCPVPSRSRAGRPKEPLAQSGPEAWWSGGGGRRGWCVTRERAGGGGE